MSIFRKCSILGKDRFMKVVHYEQINAQAVTTEGAAGCRIRCLVDASDGAPSFSMRQFEVAPGGYTPKHSHGHEHEVFILEGAGVVDAGGTEYALRPGSAVFVPPGQEHQFRNTGTGPLKFLCLIPHPLRGMSGVCAAACGCE
jgi:quercetin dioxygenase-like cupin family protein